MAAEKACAYAVCKRVMPLLLHTNMVVLDVVLWKSIEQDLNFAGTLSEKSVPSGQ